MVHRVSTQPTKQQSRIVRRPSETQSAFHERRMAALTEQLKPGQAICEACFRVVYLKRDGTLRAHNHCPNATPTFGDSGFTRLCRSHGNSIKDSDTLGKCKCWVKKWGSWVDRG